MVKELYTLSDVSLQLGWSCFGTASISKSFPV